MSKQITADEDFQIRIENQLEAVLSNGAVRGKNVDFINHLKIDRHKKSFAQVDGGYLWGFIDANKFSVSQQQLLEDAYLTKSNQLLIAGRKFVLALNVAFEPSLKSYKLDVSYTEADGAKPSVIVSDGQWRIALGNADSPTTAGTLKTILEAREEIDAVTVVGSYEAELLPDSYDPSSGQLSIAASNFCSLWQITLTGLRSA